MFSCTGHKSCLRGNLNHSASILGTPCLAGRKTTLCARILVSSLPSAGASFKDRCQMLRAVSKLTERSQFPSWKVPPIKTCPSGLGRGITYVASPVGTEPGRRGQSNAPGWMNLKYGVLIPRGSERDSWTPGAYARIVWPRMGNTEGSSTPIRDLAPIEASLGGANTRG